MQYTCLRECWLDRLYAMGERVEADIAKRWPEHFARENADIIGKEADNKCNYEKPLGQRMSLSDGTELKGLTRHELRRYAARRFPEEIIPWGRTEDMRAAVMRLDEQKR